MKRTPLVVAAIATLTVPPIAPGQDSLDVENSVEILPIWGYPCPDGSSVIDSDFSGPRWPAAVHPLCEDPTVTEAPYANGAKNGIEIERWPNGTVIETPYVNGQVHGIEIERYANGNVAEIPHVNGRIHGMSVWQDDHIRTETFYVNGLRHGTAVEHYPDGMVAEMPYVNGELHGTEVVRHADGTIEETVYYRDEVADDITIMTEAPLVAGVKHGTEIWVGNNSIVETPYVAGVIHGTEVETSPYGEVIETPYFNGRPHGMQIFDVAWPGNDFDPTEDFSEKQETPYVHGLKHGMATALSFTPSTTTLTHIPYVNDTVHGTVVELHSDGTMIETPFVNGRRHGTEVRRDADGIVTETIYLEGVEQD